MANDEKERRGTRVPINLFISREGGPPCRPIFLLPTRIRNNSRTVKTTEAVPPINGRRSAKMTLLGGQLGDLPLPGNPRVVLWTGPGVPRLVEGLNTLVRL